MMRAGMTLVELMVAMVISVMLVSIGTASFGELIDARRRTVASIDPTARSAALRTLLGAWLAGAHLTGQEDGPVFLAREHQDGRAANEVEFLTTAAPPFSDGNTMVRLFVDDDSATAESGLVAEVAEWPTGRRAVIALSPWVVAMEARFYSMQADSAGWTPSWDSSVLLPNAISLTLLSSWPDSVGRVVAVPIVVTLESSQ